MGLTESQIKERQVADQQLLDDALLRVAGVVLGQKSTKRAIDDQVAASNAIDRIMRYYRLKTARVPEVVTDFYDQLDYCLRPHGVMYREVKLDAGWYKDSFGPILAFTSDGGTPVALIPGKITGYWYIDAKTGLLVKVGARNASYFASDALCFYRPLPQKKLGVGDLLLYICRCISVGDVVVKGTAALAVTLVGLLMPRLIASRPSDIATGYWFWTTEGSRRRGPTTRSLPRAGCLPTWSNVSAWTSRDVFGGDTTLPDGR